MTAYSRVLLENWIVPQLVMELLAYYGTKRFITMLTTACHWCLSSAKSILSMPAQPIYKRSILILSSHLCLGLLSCLFPSGFHTKTLYVPLSPPYMPHACPFHSSWSDHQNNIWWGLHIIKLLMMQFPPNTILAQISSSAPCSWTSSTHIPPSMWQTEFHIHILHHFCTLWSKCFKNEKKKTKNFRLHVSRLCWTQSVLHFFMNTILMF